MKRITTLILLSFIWFAAQSQQVNFSLNLEQGKKYKQISNSTSHITQEFNGQKMNIEMSIKGTVTFLVKAINNDEYDIEVEYESLSMTMPTLQGKKEINSEKSEKGNFMSEMLTEMCNKPFQMKMTKKGKVTEIRNIETIFEAAFSKIPKLPEEQISLLKEQLKKSYGEDFFKGNMEISTAFYPENPISKGDSWEVKTELTAEIAMNVRSKYTYESEEENYYFIVGNSNLTTTNDYSELNGLSVKYNLAGTMLSKIKVDKKTGWIIEANVTQNIAGDIYFNENEELPEGMKIPMSIKNDIEITNK